MSADLPTLHSPAAERNKDVILDVLSRSLPQTGIVLEIASGSGQHIVHFARALPNLRWQPSDVDSASLDSIAARIAQSGLGNVDSPLRLDVHEHPWALNRADVVICINMIHISPWSATEALFEGAAALLDEGAPLILYGPFMRHGKQTAPSNAAFDRSLRTRNPEWGVRDLETVASLAGRHGFSLGEVNEMPANNLSVMLYRAPAARSE